MKVLLCGDAAVATGFARCTHAACDALHAAGHEVSVLGVNHCGDPTPDYPYPIYPTRVPFTDVDDGMGFERLRRMLNGTDPNVHLEPDVIVLLCDPWYVERYVTAIDGYAPAVGWLALDGLNMSWATQLNRLKTVVWWTEFAANEARRGGYEGPQEVIPLGVDTDVFYPRDRDKCRAEILSEVSGMVPEDAFIVGCVGRNQPRKRLDLTISFFAHWILDYKVDDAYLFLHANPTGEKGYELTQLAEYFGVRNRVIFSTPSVGKGASTEGMAYIYNCMDAYMTTTQGEGWGLPVHEAMACGVPCIVPEWSALGEWTEDAAMKVPCAEISATINYVNVIGGIPVRAKFLEGLDRLYRDTVLRKDLSDKGFSLATRDCYRWSDIGRRFCGVLEGAVSPKLKEVVA